MPWVVGRLDTDVYHSPDFIPPLRYRGRSVITIHDLAFLIYPHFVTKDGARYYGQIDRAVRKADHIIAVSHSTKNDLVRMLGIPEDYITVIHEAGPHAPHTTGRSPAARWLCMACRTVYPLRFHHRAARKNVGGLLKAYQRRVMITSSQPRCAGWCRLAVRRCL